MKDLSQVRRDALALGLLLSLTLLFWGRVLFTGVVLLPGEMLRGFLPFGGDLTAPWNILQWDSLAQYYPWRLLAARDLHAGHIPLWNPFQFTGYPFLANAQSGVFYPLNLPFWCLDTAYAFGVVAALHTLLALWSTWFLARRWGMSRAAAVLAACGFGFCGYLAAWSLLPTLAATASWLPLCLLLLEKASDPTSRNRKVSWLLLALALTCALLAGHAQVFFYLLLGLALRQPFLPDQWRGLRCLVSGILTAGLLGAAQLLPTLEIARLGHRAAGGPIKWEFWTIRALQYADLPAIAIPGWPLQGIPSVNENFPYVGSGVLLLAVVGTWAAWGALRQRRGHFVSDRVPHNLPEPVSRGKSDILFCVWLALWGLAYALATTAARVIFYGVPGVSQMGGPGRALLLWSLGAALLAGFGFDWLRARMRFGGLFCVAFFWIGAELFGNAWLTVPTAPRSTIYPSTSLTSWLAQHSSPRSRVLFYTPRGDWQPSEFLRGQRHPEGILPPNGATVYGIYDVNGYDSLSPNQYREWIGNEEVGSPSPLWNGNMILLNNLSKDWFLDSFSVRYVVLPSDSTLEVPGAHAVLTEQGCTVWERVIAPGGSRVNGSAFVPGWRDGVYQPTSFRFGLYLSLCALAMVAGAASHTISKGAASRRRDSSITLS